MENMVDRREGHDDHARDSEAIVPAIEKARDAGLLVIALDTPTEPEDAADTLSRPTTTTPAS